MKKFVKYKYERFIGGLIFGYDKGNIIDWCVKELSSVYV